MEIYYGTIEAHPGAVVAHSEVMKTILEQRKFTLDQ
jgi:hypothetical protein